MEAKQKDLDLLVINSRETAVEIHNKLINILSALEGRVADGHALALELRILIAELT